MTIGTPIQGQDQTKTQSTGQATSRTDSGPASESSQATRLLAGRDAYPDQFTGEILLTTIDRTQYTAKLTGITLGLWTWSFSQPRVVIQSELMQRVYGDVCVK